MTANLFQSLSLWLHLISLSLWIGGIAFFLFVFAPAVHGLPPENGILVLDKGRRSLEIISWTAIVLLSVSGVLNLLFRAIASSFQLGPVYYSVVALKLFLFLAMVFHHCLQAFKHSPQIVSLTSQAPREIQSWPEPLLLHWKKWFVLLKINATLGPIVVLLGLGLSRN